MTFDPRKTTAKQIMEEDVLTFHRETSVRDAIATLDEHRVAGAPVVNDSEECVGVFTGDEAVRKIAAFESAEVPGAGAAARVLEEAGESSEARPGSEPGVAVLEEEAIERWMSTEPGWVSPETTVEEVCRRMARNGVQRVLVLEGKRIRGIISTLDVVRFVAGLKPVEDRHRMK